MFQQLDSKTLDSMRNLVNKVKETKHEEKALRYNEGKLEWSLIHWKSLIPMVKVLMFGASKYSPNNWMKGMTKAKILDSLLRHTTALCDGEENDPESKLSHIGHILCNAMFYSFYTQTEEGKTKLIKE